MNFLIGLGIFLIVPLAVGKFVKQIILPKEQSDTFADWVMGFILSVIICLILYVLLKASYTVGSLIIK